VTRPAVVAGFVGVGVAVVVVIGFALVFAVQVLVFLLALPVGLLIGWYANARDRTAMTVAASGPSDRAEGVVASSRVPVRFGWPRALANGVIAGLFTGLALAVLYVLVRLLFLYLDTGFRAGGPPYACAAGPACGYQRALEEPRLREALEAAGVHDAAGYTAFFLEGQALGGGALVVLVLTGALIGAAPHALGSVRTPPSTIGGEGAR